jgi:hypothetical protein
MGCRRLGRLRRPGNRALDFAELGLALDGEQRHRGAAARPVLERPAIERRPVIVRRFSRRKGTVRRWPFGQIPSSGRPLRPQAAEAGASRAISIMLQP